MNLAEVVSRNPSGRATVPKQAKPRVIYLHFLVRDRLRKLPVLTQAGRITNLHARYLHVRNSALEPYCPWKW